MDYVKVVVENFNNFTIKYTNKFYIKKIKICPGLLYKIHDKTFLCTCYEIDEQYEPITYFFTELEDIMVKVALRKNIIPINLNLLCD